MALLFVLGSTSETEKQTITSTIGSSTLSLEYWTTIEPDTPTMVNMNGILSLTDGNTGSWDSSGQIRMCIEIGTIETGLNRRE